MSLPQVLQFVLNHPLNRRRRREALLRFVRWQIGSRLVPGAVAFEWVAGTRLLVRPGETGATQNIYCGLHDFEDMSYLLHVLSAEDLFLDVGANIGSYTVLACGAKGARGICFEPVPTTYVRLCDNLAVNHLASRVTALNIGLAETEGELKFTSEQNSMNHVLAAGETSAQSVAVPVRTLDSVLSGQAPSMMKIDVEGFEWPVLNGASATLTNPSLHSIVIELNGSGERYGYSDEAVFEKLRGLGFAPFTYEPFSRQLRPASRINHDGNNTLLIRNEAAVREKLHRAPRFSIGGYDI